MARLEDDLIKKSKEINALKCTISKLEEQIYGPRKFTIDDVKDNDRSVHMYTGLQNYSAFRWLFKHLEIKTKLLTFYETVKPSTTKRGCKRKLSFEN